MKFFININQEKLIKIEPKIRIVEAVILDYIYWLCSSVSPEVAKNRIIGEDGLQYTWINYDWALKEMPLLKGRTKATLVPIFKKLEDFEFIKSITKRWEDGGDRKYIALLSKIEGLFNNLNDPVKKSKRPRLENYTNQYTNNQYINNNTIAEQSSASAEEKFSLEEEVKKLEDSPRRYLNIVALYFEHRKLKLENKKQYQVALNRHLRAAKQLEPFNDKQITNALDKAKREYPEYTLETLIKLLTK